MLKEFFLVLYNTYLHLLVGIFKLSIAINLRIPQYKFLASEKRKEHCGTQKSSRKRNMKLLKKNLAEYKRR